MSSIVSKNRHQGAVAALRFVVLLGLLPAFGDQTVLVADEPTDDSTVQKKAADAEATDTKATDKASVPNDGVTIQFNFRFHPWKDALDWFAQQADLSLVLDSPPLGTLNYTDNRRHTPSEALDILNSVLLIKGYTLIQHERMLILINLADGVPPELIPQVPPEDLDQHGEFELVRCLFKLEVATPEEAE